jgi:hypothetical protein
VGALEGEIVGENDGAFEGVPVGGGGGGGWKIPPMQFVKTPVKLL